MALNMPPYDYIPAPVLHNTVPFVHNAAFVVDNTGPVVHNTVPVVNNGVLESHIAAHTLRNGVPAAQIATMSFRVQHLVVAMQLRPLAAPWWLGVYQARAPDKVGNVNVSGAGAC